MMVHENIKDAENLPYEKYHLNMNINQGLYLAPDTSLIKKYEFTDYQKALMELNDEFPGVTV